MNENKVDRAIDRAVQTLMSAEPRPGMRGRVLARLDEAPRGTMRWPGLGFAALTMAAILVGVYVFRSDPAVTPAPRQVAVSEPAAPSPDPAQPTTIAPAPRPVEAAPSTAPAASPDPAARQPRPQAPRTEELPPPPRMDDVFGPRSNRVAAANAGTPQGTAKTANLRLEFVFTLEGEGMEPARKTVTMVVADNQMGRHRSSEGDHVIIEARPRVLPDGRVQVTAKLEYRARGSEGSGLGDSVSTVLEDGQALVVSKAADGRAKRQISVELKATTLK
jgi:hypothetical protein